MVKVTNDENHRKFFLYKDKYLIPCDASISISSRFSDQQDYGKRFDIKCPNCTKTFGDDSPIHVRNALLIHMATQHEPYQRDTAKALESIALTNNQDGSCSSTCCTTNNKHVNLEAFYKHFITIHMKFNDSEEESETGSDGETHGESEKMELEQN